jgi:predicted DNA-binding protein (MmcQ/YjbR family)
MSSAHAFPTVHPLKADLLAFALSLPEAWEDHPWGESVAKVGKKVFAFFGVGEADGGFGFTVKLRDSHEEAMSFEWVVPAAYGLDRGGWVSAAVPDDAPLEMITGWIEESYRLVAPKKLAALLDDRPPR